ncbi:TIGR02594 family protein [Fulvivirga kasyanovii]|uniref:TIGR02594 family protein n=1 Tax=Fulvivirga kasyanovii TaxID=396812 RepID=A0ABW9RXH5_9BACT|nr:TIGR02594 family protein [Fulvivirga kasyanovii]MTI28972.1 TIGR02594 family protein [Fulvivirga kasyanovii]
MIPLINIALSQYGVKEVPGKLHNPTIINYSWETGFKGIIDDETSWCSVFMNWCALKAGLQRSKQATARSWLKVGQVIRTAPKPGDIVIFWRESPASWKGHVGIFISYSEDKKLIYCLGGNQSNMVCIAPYEASKLLGFRRLLKA